MNLKTEQTCTHINIFSKQKNHVNNLKNSNTMPHNCKKSDVPKQSMNRTFIKSNDKSIKYT